MHLTRRTWLGAAAATGAVAASTAFAVAGAAPSAFSVKQAARHDYAAALVALQAYASRELKTIGLPGMTLCVVDADGFVALATFGWADVDRRIPVSTANLFQIGSISKAFAALTIFHLSEAGKIDLDAPLAKYLPDAMLPETPITVSQVLNHTAGLADSAPIFPRVAGGRLWCGFKPGTSFSYSNTGYELLGHLIDRVAGKPHPDAIREAVLTPLGMTATKGIITDRDRAQYAMGYIPFYQDRPSLTQAPMTIGPWTDLDSAAGSIASTAEQMAHYLQFLLTLGNGKGAPLLSDRAAQRFIKSVTDAPVFGPKARYGNGIGTVLVDGKPCLHHTGGMITFTSSFHVDPVAGVACFASVNGSLGDYRPRKTTAFAVQLMRAVRAKAHLPAAPNPIGKLAVLKPSECAGRFVSDTGDTLEFKLQGGQLVLESGGITGRVQQSDKDSLMTDHPQWAPHILSYVRDGGKITALWWGEKLLGRNAKVPQPGVPDRLRALAGTYLNRDPWVGGAVVLAQGNRLILEGGGELTETKDGYWKLSDPPQSPERFVFDAPLDGRAFRLTQSGSDMLRGIV
jgi:CubicO group peptidase (beta-lactamase class C family)